VFLCIFVGAIIGLHDGDDFFVVAGLLCLGSASKHIIESEYIIDRTEFHYIISPSPLTDSYLLI